MSGTDGASATSAAKMAEGAMVPGNFVQKQMMHAPSMSWHLCDAVWRARDHSLELHKSSLSQHDVRALTLNDTHSFCASLARCSLSRRLVQAVTSPTTTQVSTPLPSYACPTRCLPPSHACPTRCPLLWYARSGTEIRARVGTRLDPRRAAVPSVGSASIWAVDSPFFWGGGLTRGCRAGVGGGGAAA
eukprot:252788-Rhodomonas_salina.1